MNTVTIVLLCLVGSLIFHQIVTWIQIRDLKKLVDDNSAREVQTFFDVRRAMASIYSLEQKERDTFKRIEEQKLAKDTLRMRCHKLENTSVATNLELDNLTSEWRTARKILESQIEGIRSKADREIGMFTTMVQRSAVEKKTIDDIMARLGSLETRQLLQRVGHERVVEISKRLDRNTDAFATLEKDVREIEGRLLGHIGVLDKKITDGLIDSGAADEMDNVIRNIGDARHDIKILQDAVRANADRVTRSIEDLEKNKSQIRDTQRVVTVLDTVISGHIRATDRHVKLPVRKSVRKPVKKATPAKRKKS